jgi:hypothetical protein
MDTEMTARDWARIFRELKAEVCSAAPAPGRQRPRKVLVFRADEAGQACPREVAPAAITASVLRKTCEVAGSAHDAAIYRKYQAESNVIAKRRGAIRRVVLDYELKKKVYGPLAKARALPPIEFAKCQAEV